MFDVIQHENSVLVDDTHADDRAQIRDDAQRGAGNEQREDDAEHGQHRAENDCNRRIERTELQQGHREDQNDCHDQHHHQVAEGFFLLLVKSAVFNTAGREVGVSADELTDVGHGAAEVAPLQAGADGDVLAHVFPVQFQFARTLDDVGHLKELHDGAIGRP